MRWDALFRRGANNPPGTRWIVLDVEASGLDAGRDRLLAIAAVALRFDPATRHLAIAPADSFEVVLRQDVPSARDNILLHGIGAQRQADGVQPAEAMQAFAAFAAGAPRLAFHASFDRELVGRYSRAGEGSRQPARWADIEHLCGVAYPEVPARSLDEWMAHFGIRCAARHRAAADALAESELLLRVWPRIAAEVASWRDLEKVAARRRWLARG